jgi:hypothetical protein
MDMSPELVALAVGLFGGVGTFMVQKLFKALRERNAMVDTLERAAGVVDTLQNLCRTTQASKALVLYTSNGGGIPHPGNQVYVSILYEVVMRGEPIKHLFQKHPLDEHYTVLVAGLLAKGEAWYDGEAAGFMQALYDKEGVARALIVPILTSKERFYYLSVRWDSAITYEEVALEVKAAAREIQKLIG